MSFGWHNLCQHSDRVLLRTTRWLGPLLRDALRLHFREPVKNSSLSGECYSSSQEASLLLYPLQRLALQSQMRRPGARPGFLGLPKNNTELRFPIRQDSDYLIGDVYVLPQCINVPDAQQLVSGFF